MSLLTPTQLPDRPQFDAQALKLQRRHTRQLKLFEPALVRMATVQSVLMLDPRNMARNPVMFLVEVGWILTTLITIESIATGAPLGLIIYQAALAFLLLLTVLFANFAEALAEARGKAQAQSLRATRQDTIAFRAEPSGETTEVCSTELKTGDRVVVEAGQLIPADGEIVEGLASVDESAITGESAPVIREAGGDRSGVTGGTKVLSDRIVVEVTAGIGESFLDRMIALVEGASRQKTPNEIALTIILAAFSIIFLIVTATLYPMARYFEITLDIPTLIALLVCLIPTTIGALLAAIGIAGMDRALAANLIAKSGKAVEVAGDVDTLLLDKTGTITLGNRRATLFVPMQGTPERELARLAAMASLADTTPEGKSIVELSRLEFPMDLEAPAGSRFVEFTAQTRMSGIDLPDGQAIRKGAPNTIAQAVLAARGTLPDGYQEMVDSIASKGATPLAVATGDQIAGLIKLEDILKQGIRERFARLRQMGLRVVMVTGDNPLTAKAIADEAGVDDFIAQATPEAKLAYIRKEQTGGKLVAMMGDGTNDAPALAQADIGVAMNSGTQAAKEAGNMVDLDSDPTKLIEVVEIGKQLLMTRGALTTFSIANDLAKYFAVIPAMFVGFKSLASLRAIDLMGLATKGGAQSAILSAVIFNAVIIPLLIPIALKGVAYHPVGASALLRRNLLYYGLGGVIAPFIGIKLIDLAIDPLLMLGPCRLSRLGSTGAESVRTTKRRIIPMIGELVLALRACALTFVLCAVAYPAIVWGAAQLLFPSQADGSLIYGADGTTIIASELVAQPFVTDRYFHPRPSAVDYKADAAAGSNLGTNNPDLRKAIASRVEALEATADRPAPVDLVTASGSGLDPDISPEGAAYQAPRVATARGVSIEKVRALIDRQTDRSGALIGAPPRVNVLVLNLALDREQGGDPRFRVH